MNASNAIVRNTVAQILIEKSELEILNVKFKIALEGLMREFVPSRDKFISREQEIAFQYAKSALAQASDTE